MGTILNAGIELPIQLPENLHGNKRGNDPSTRATNSVEVQEEVFESRPLPSTAQTALVTWRIN